MEPIYVVHCPYCRALVPIFRDKATARCTACGGQMRILKPGDSGYLDAAQSVKRKEKE